MGKERKTIRSVRLVIGGTMLSKELEILRHIEELYKNDISEEDFLIKVQGKETQISAWAEAFSDYELSDVLNVLDEYFAKRNNRTPPRIAQIKAMLNANGIIEEKKTESTHEDYLPDYDIRYMNEDVENGDCHYNRYYYTEALKRIRNNEYLFVKDIQNPTKSELKEVMEELCEKKTGNKIEFLSRNDLISQGYDMERKYSAQDLINSMFKRM